MCLAMLPCACACINSMLSLSAFEGIDIALPGTAQKFTSSSWFSSVSLWPFTSIEGDLSPPFLFSPFALPMLSPPPSPHQHLQLRTRRRPLPLKLHQLVLFCVRNTPQSMDYSPR